MTATSYAPAMRLHLANARLNNCTFENMTGPAPFAVSSSKLVISGGSIDAGITLYMSTASVEIGGNVSLLRIGNNGEAGAVVISSGASINLTSSINPGGTGGITVLDGGCTVNGTTISAGTYTSIDSTGTPT